VSSDEQPAAPALRASDAERERAATLLREHTAAGRLEPEELAERLDAAYGARTVAELDALLADLPAPPAPPPAPRRSRTHAKRRLAQRAGTLGLVFLVCVLVWALSGGGSFWPRWVALFAAIRLAFLSWALLGPGTHDEARLGRGGSRRLERGSD
jgi:Domain of unknown function (DUF1707)